MNPPLRILYAEDNPQDADLAMTHFKRAAPDLQLEILGTGEQCQERLASGSFDLLLLDNHLPDIDGIDVLKRLRQEGHRLPVVMLTIVGDEKSVSRALLAGADDYVTKAGDYLSRLPSILRSLVERVSSRPFDEAAAQRERRILYVEPHHADAELTLAHFAAHAPHLKLRIVDRCDDALEILKKDQSFDLVLSDLRVPSMNALEFFHETLGRGIDIPFIVITGHGDEQTAVALLRLGASDYLIKRDNYLTQLPHAIENALHRAHLDRTTRRLRADLAALNQSLEQKVAARTAELRFEIRERERADAELRATLERHARTLENMLEGCCVFDKQWRYLYVNEAGARHARKPKDELIGRRLMDVFPGLDSTALFSEMRRCMDDRVHIHIDSAFTSGANQSAWFEISLDPSPEGVFMLSIDITEKKLAEDALRASENDLSATLRSIGDAVIATDPVGRVTRMNTMAEKLTEWTIEDAIGKPLTDVFPIFDAETGAAVADPVQKVIEHGQIVGLANHTTLVSKSGERYQIADTAAPITDDGGHIRGAVLVFKDVSEDYRIQQILKEREEQLTLITNAMPGPVVRISREGRYLFVNQTFARWMGRPASAIVGHSLTELFGSRWLLGAMPYIKRVLAGETVTYDIDVPVAGGDPVPSLLTLVPDPHHDGSIGGYIAIGMDMTERRNTEEKLRKSEAMIHLAGRMARLGGWGLDLNPMRLTWTDEVCDIHELPHGHQVTLDESIGFVAPEWQDLARAGVSVCIETGAPFDIQVEIISAQGRRLWARATGEAQRNEAGVITRVHGALQDIDDHKRGEKRISDQLSELIRWQNAMINREGRAQQLKSEVNELRGKLNLAPKYRTVPE